MKRCSKCGLEQPFENFYRAAETRDGLRGDCKACFAARAKARYAKTRKSDIERVKAWQAANRERHLANLRARHARPEVKRHERDMHLRRNYGMTIEEYDELLAEQGGVCAICEKPPRSDISLHVDHNHETGQRRGLLCWPCNSAIGNAGDDPARLNALASYLVKYTPRLPEIDARLAALKALAGR